MAFDSDYDTVLVTKARRDRLDVAIAEVAADSESTPLVQRLGCVRGRRFTATPTCADS